MEKQTHDDDTARQLRRIHRREEMKRRKRRQALFRQICMAGILILTAVIITFVFMKKREKDETSGPQHTITADRTPSSNTISVSQAGIRLNPKQEISENALEDDMPAEEEPPFYQYASTDDTLALTDEITSSYCVFVDLGRETILAGKREKERMIPASMTKVLTLLVAAEHMSSLDGSFTITREITDYCYENDCSAAGFEKEETVSVKDLLYGTILPSGADAALGLAFYTAGSQEAFVELMNEKLEELGLSETSHFTNCVGIFDDNHYSTAYDMAVIMNAAIRNEICREVLCAHTYKTSLTEQHPEGILLSNWFLRRIEDKDTKAEVICGKTGYVIQSGSCAVSYGADDTGTEYICVTADGSSQWTCINDHAGLYKRFSDPGE